MSGETGNPSVHASVVLLAICVIVDRQVCCRCHRAARKDLAKGVRKPPRNALQVVTQDVDMCLKLEEFAGTRLKLMLDLPRGLDEHRHKAYALLGEIDKKYRERGRLQIRTQ